MFSHVGKLSDLQINYERLAGSLYLHSPPNSSTYLYCLLCSSCEYSSNIDLIMPLLGRFDGSSSSTRSNPYILVRHTWSFPAAPACISSPILCSFPLHPISLPAIPMCFSQWHCFHVSIFTYTIFFALIVSCLSVSFCFSLFCQKLTSYAKFMSYIH